MPAAPVRPVPGSRTSLRPHGLIAGFSLLVAGLPAAAFEPLSGQFLAWHECPATIGIARPPDGVSVQPGASYPALGLNRQDGAYIQIRLAGAKPGSRWVRLDCGEWRPGPAPAQAPALVETPRPSRLLLALSWQPAFCEGRPDAVECRTQTAARHDADHLSLHGLWPQPRGLEYCGVSPRDRATDERRRWDALPPVALQADTASRLARLMPGAASGLERHEWLRHGSCSGADAEQYYRTALALLDQVNRSRLRDTLTGRLGETVTVGQLQGAFESSFGPGSGQALAIRCSRDGQRRLISEIHIQLRAPISDTTALRDALDRSSPARGNCESGVVDRAGLD